MTALNTLIAASLERALYDAANGRHAQCYRELMRMRDVFPCAEMSPVDDDEWLSAWHSSHDADGSICPECLVESGVKAVRDSFPEETRMSDVLSEAFDVEDGYVLREEDLETFASTVGTLLWLVAIRDNVNDFALNYIRTVAARHFKHKTLREATRRIKA